MTRGGTWYTSTMLRVVLIDARESAHFVAALEQLVTANGRPLKVGLLDRDAAELDLKRTVSKLGSRAPLEDWLLVTDDVRRARGAHGVEVLAFEDPATVPLLVAARIGESRATSNLEPALRYYLHARREIDLSSIEGATPERITFRATAWRPIEGDELGDVSGVRTPFPVGGVATLRSDGSIESLQISEPSDEDVREAKSFVASLVHHGQLQTHAQGQRARGTHQIVIDADGQRRLVRARAGHR